MVPTYRYELTRRQRNVEAVIVRSIEEFFTTKQHEIEHDLRLTHAFNVVHVLQETRRSLTHREYSILFQIQRLRGTWYGSITPFESNIVRFISFRAVLEVEEGYAEG